MAATFFAFSPTTPKEDSTSDTGGSELSGDFSYKYMLGRVCSDVMKRVEVSAHLPLVG